MDRRMTSPLNPERLSRLFTLTQLRQLRDDALNMWDNMRYNPATIAQAEWYHDCALVYCDAIAERRRGED